MAQYECIAVYILANRKNGTLYTGVTSDLVRRMDQHKSGAGSAFAAKYGCKTLVWFERFNDINDAIHREKRIKEWKRQWKINLIEESNPDWFDRTMDI